MLLLMIMMMMMMAVMQMQLTTTTLSMPITCCRRDNDDADDNDNATQYNTGCETFAFRCLTTRRVCVCVCVWVPTRPGGKRGTLPPLLTKEPGKTSRFAPVPFMGLF